MDWLDPNSSSSSSSNSVMTFGSGSVRGGGAGSALTLVDRSSGNVGSRVGGGVLPCMKGIMLDEAESESNFEAFLEMYELLSTEGKHLSSSIVLFVVLLLNYVFILLSLLCFIYIRLNRITEASGFRPFQY